MHVYVHIVAKCAAAKPLSDAHFCDPPEGGCKNSPKKEAKKIA
jgi:hypothetical protein